MTFIGEKICFMFDILQVQAMRYHKAGATGRTHRRTYEVRE